MTRKTKHALRNDVADSASASVACLTEEPTGTIPAVAEAANGKGILGPSLHVVKFSAWEENEQLKPLWDKLLPESSSPTIFLTWEWLLSWWKVFGDSRELVLLACFDPGGQLLGLAPLYREPRRVGPGFSLRVLRLVGDGTGDSDNLDWIVRPGRETAVVNAFLDWLARHRSEWDLLELNTVPVESATSRALFHELQARKWSLCQEERPRQLIPLPADWESYLRSLSRNMRSAVVSKLRRLEKSYTVRLRRCETELELSSSLDILFQLHTRRWGLRGEQGSFHPARQRFYREMTQRFLARGWLDFWLLDLDGQTVATQLGFHYGETYCFLQSGFDPAYAAMSVGFVLTSLILRELIRRGIRGYDFLAGEEPHKQRWGAERRSYSYLRCAPPRSRGAVYLGVARAGESSKDWLRDQLSPSAWRRLSWVYQRLRSLRPPGNQGAPAGKNSPAWAPSLPAK